MKYSNKSNIQPTYEGEERERNRRKIITMNYSNKSKMELTHRKGGRGGREKKRGLLVNMKI